MTQEEKDYKERLFAQYWGQEVVMYGGAVGQIVKNDAQYLYYSSMHRTFDEDYLELTPLSAITDEHAIEVAKIFHPDYEEFREDGASKEDGYSALRDIYGYWETHDFNEALSKTYIPSTTRAHIDDYSRSITVDQFLRKNGYATPFEGKSVEEQVKLGYIKLKES